MNSVKDISAKTNTASLQSDVGISLLGAYELTKPASAFSLFLPLLSAIWSMIHSSITSAFSSLLPSAPLFPLPEPLLSTNGWSARKTPSCPELPPVLFQQGLLAHNLPSFSESFFRFSVWVFFGREPTNGLSVSPFLP